MYILFNFQNGNPDLDSANIHLFPSNHCHSQISIKFLLVKSSMKFDTLDDCNLPTLVYFKSIDEIWYIWRWLYPPLLST